MMSDAIVAFDDSFRPKFTTLIRDVRNQAAQSTAKRLKKQLLARQQRTLALGYRLAAEPAEIKGWDFNTTSEEAKAWVKEHAAETLDDLSQSTRDAIQSLLEHAFDGEYDVDDLTDQITSLIGDPERAEVIARTETMTAANAGQQEAWEQAVADGLLTGQENRVWIVTPDDRLCPICAPMEDVEAGMNEEFNVDGDQVSEPPAHPRCRCTLGLVLD
jgi:hypothetical protein